jgi:hypothetical protein
LKKIDEFSKLNRFEIDEFSKLNRIEIGTDLEFGQKLEQI